MIRITKHETHSFILTTKSLPIDLEMLSKIYPDLSKEDLDKKMQDIIDGQVDPEEIVEFVESGDSGVEFDWADAKMNWYTADDSGSDLDARYVFEACDPNTDDRSTSCPMCGQG
jgi:hypothetical protein